MKILGIDYGTERIGLAISDELGLMAHPFKTIGHKELNVLIEIINKEGIDAVVVGKPIRLNGSYSDKTREAIDFAERIKRLLKIPVHMQDERFSTKEAGRTLLDANISRKKRKKIIDRSSARVILQAYLDANKTKKDV